MNILNKKGYLPVDDNSETGYRRPPKDIPAICDYFAHLGMIEDEGKFMHSEMRKMLTDPENFFEVVAKPPVRVGPFGDPIDDDNDPMDWEAFHKK